MNEELSTIQHGTFIISKKTEIKHRVFSVLILIKGDMKNLSDWILKLYNVSQNQVESYIHEFNKLNKIK